MEPIRQAYSLPVAVHSLDDWFETHILPHEDVLMRYLKRARIKAADLSDLRQEIYIRVYESAARALPDSPKAFLMSIARHLLVDRVRHERIISIDYRPDLSDPAHDFDDSNVLIEERSPERSIGARQELRRLSDGFDRLSEDCRKVLWLRRVEGLSQRQVAEKLRMQEGTVSSHLSRALRALTNLSFGGRFENDARDSKDSSDKGGDDNETGHG